MSDLEAQAEGFARWLVARVPEGGPIRNGEYAEYVGFCITRGLPPLTQLRWARAMGRSLGPTRVTAEDGRVIRVRDLHQSLGEES